MPAWRKFAAGCLMQTFRNSKKRGMFRWFPICSQCATSWNIWSANPPDPLFSRRACPPCARSMRWIWIDKFTEFTSKTSATAIKTVTLAEEHLHDLYPAFPIVPHSLIVEGMAQTSGILVGEARGFAEKVILAKIGRAV